MFFGQSGFHSSKTSFVPVGAILGVNLVERKAPESTVLSKWYKGPTLVDLLGRFARLHVAPCSSAGSPDTLEPPVRDIASPLRLPISNVFRGQSSGIGITGRICGGIVQVGERVRVMPGDEIAVVKCKTHIQTPTSTAFFNILLAIEVDERSVTWAVAGSNTTLYLTAIDHIHVNIGSVLCPPTDLVLLATSFAARIIVFDIQLPIITGASVCVPRRRK
jgi:elongation factor 1 alpha-like protein